VVDVKGQPRLVFLATKTIQIGDELLFDYNDSQSGMPFLKQCAVCVGSGKRPATSDTDEKRDADTEAARLEDSEPTDPRPKRRKQQAAAADDAQDGEES